MSDTLQTLIFSLAAVICVTVLCGAMVYGCTNSNQQYYAAFNQCVSAGGSAIPTSANNGAGIVCVKK